MIAVFDWYRFIAIQLWIFVLFLICETAVELNHLFGEDELRHILLTSRPAELPLNRRQRVLELVRLNKLTDVHTVDELWSPRNTAHAELIAILQRLAADKPWATAAE